MSYCLAKLDDILRRKDEIFVTLGNDQAKNGKFGSAGAQVSEASTNFLSG